MLQEGKQRREGQDGKAAKAGKGCRRRQRQMVMERLDEAMMKVGGMDY